MSEWHALDTRSSFTIIQKKRNFKTRSRLISGFSLQAETKHQWLATVDSSQALWSVHIVSAASRIQKHHIISNASRPQNSLFSCGSTALWNQITTLHHTMSARRSRRSTYKSLIELEKRAKEAAPLFGEDALDESEDQSFDADRHSDDGEVRSCTKTTLFLMPTQPKCSPVLSLTSLSSPFSPL